MQSTSKAALIALVVSLLASPAASFQQSLHKPAFARTGQPLSSRTPTKPTSASSTAVSMTLEDVNTFYQTYPLQAAVLTCGVKASFADMIAQVQAWSETENAIEMKRNAAYIIYGGIFIGLFCHIEYDIIFPLLFGHAHDVKTIIGEVLFDNFVSAPLVVLPPAYFIKAILFDFPLEEGLQRYKTDIQEGLLTKYWTMWLPAQTFSFSVVPDHLRVVWMAMVSFVWFIILSSAQAETDSAADDLAEVAAPETVGESAFESSSSS